MNIRLLIKLFAIAILSLFLSNNYDYSKNPIVNYEFVLSAVMSFFAVSLAITAIYFTVLDRLKQNSKIDFDFETNCNSILSEMIDNVKLLLFIIIAYFSINLLSEPFASLDSIIRSINDCFKPYSTKNFILVLGLILTLVIIYDITISIGRLIKIIIELSSDSDKKDKYTRLTDVAKELDDKHFKKLLDYLRELITDQKTDKDN